MGSFSVNGQVRHSKGTWCGSYSVGRQYGFFRGTLCGILSQDGLPSGFEGATLGGDGVLDRHVWH